MFKIKLETLEDWSSVQVKDLLEKVEKSKKMHASNKDEEKANECWRIHQSLLLNGCFIEAFYKIKNRQYRDAWCDLEQCEIQAKFLIENSDEEFQEFSRTLKIAKMVTQWQELFPYTLFNSIGMTVGYYTCSICDHKIRPRSRCSHKKGKIYNGELCLHIGHDLEMHEISIVTKPVHKASVLHIDENLDFSLIDYLSNALAEPFDDWKAEHKTKAFPIERFTALDRNSHCPCKSGAAFIDCCANKTEVCIPHVDFALEKTPVNGLEEVRFPY